MVFPPKKTKILPKKIQKYKNFFGHFVFFGVILSFLGGKNIEAFLYFLGGF